MVTVGALDAGTKADIIPDRAELLLNVRSYAEVVRTRVLEAIDRVVRAESDASRAPRPPDIVPTESAPAVVNEAAAVDRTRGGAPLVFWLLGGADPAAFAGASTVQELTRVVAGLLSNHSPHYAPLEDPTLRVGVEALTAAATAWLTPAT